MSFLKGLRPSGSMIVAMIALIAALGGTAWAAATISTKDIENGAVNSKKVKDQSLKTKDFNKKTKAKLKGATGPAGPAGPAGAAGPQGPVGPGTAATYTNPEWAPIDRNTIGSPVEALRAGPIVGTAANQKPPFGIGSLGLEVNAPTGDANSPTTEKASFGNQLDFTGQEVSSITQLGFRVFTTGENTARGNPNMPNIAIEIDPNLNAKPSNFSTLNFLPPQSASGVWSPYIDATTTPASPTGTGFTLSGAAGEATATGCNLATPCTFTQVQTALADGGDTAKIGTVAIAKGRDFAFQGAVDGLRVNGTVYDFEPFGVQETTP